MLAVPTLEKPSSLSSFFVSLLQRFVLVAVVLSVAVTPVHAQELAQFPNATVNVNSNTTDIAENAAPQKGDLVGGSKEPVNKQVKDLEESNSSDKANVFTLTDKINNATIASWTSLLAGCEIAGACTDYSGDQNSQISLMGSLKTSIVAMFTTQPANSRTAIADAMKSAGFNIAEPAYAQGIGFAALDPILDTWKIFRNLAFLFFILAFVIIGFMIMFRQKVGQTAVTAQQAIPQIIVALIVVTFSYAIAGLLIDFMYLIMYLMVGIFGQDSSLIDMNAFSLGGYLITNGLSQVGAIGSFVDSTISSYTTIVSGAIGLVSSAIFFLIIMVAILFGMFRLFFELLKTYVSIVISIALAPIILMFGAIPGRNSFMSWLQSLIGNLAAFPTVLMVIIIFNMITQASGNASSGFLPPYLLGGGSAGIIPTLVGLGLILALPEIVVKVKESLGAKDSFGWLSSAAFKSMDQGKVALPYISGLAGGAYGLGANIRDINRTDQDPSLKWKSIREKTAKGALDGWKIGRTAQKYYERGREGRLGQVEDVETLLANLQPKSDDKK